MGRSAPIITSFRILARGHMFVCLSMFRGAIRRFFVVLFRSIAAQAQCLAFTL